MAARTADRGPLEPLRISGIALPHSISNELLNVKL
jgi:hypothetical protein